MKKSNLTNSEQSRFSTELSEQAAALHQCMLIKDFQGIKDLRVPKELFSKLMQELFDKNYIIQSPYDEDETLVLRFPVDPELFNQDPPKSGSPFAKYAINWDSHPKRKS